MAYTTFRLEQTASVARITLDRPSVKNAFDDILIRELTEALDVIASGQPKMLEFGVADETAWNVGLSCGGTIRVFVEKVGQS